MKTYTIEFFYNNDCHSNKFLRLLNEEDIDVEVNYRYDKGRLEIDSVLATNDICAWPITHTCRLFGAMEELQSACEFDFTGRIVKEMFDNYPQLAEPILSRETKEQMIKRINELP